MKNRSFFHATAILCVLVMVFSLSSCSSKEEKSVTVNDITAIAIVSEAFSADFAASANPLRADSKGSYAVGLLTSEPIMYKDADGKWKSKNGSISISEEGGKTVATVKLQSGLKYYGGQTVTISDYINLLQQIVNYTYDGYFKDYYKNPIEGLVAYRFKYSGLKLSDLPDFEAQAREKLKNPDAESYKEMLLSTSIAGLYDGNAAALSYDGKSFRQAIEADDPSLPQNYFTVTGHTQILERLADIYARRPRTEWILDLLYDPMLAQITDTYRADLEAQKRPPSGISGVKKVNDRTCTVTFEKIVSENEAIEMLNLPLLFPNGSRRMGAFNYKSSSSGDSGYALSLVNKEGLCLTVYTVSYEEAQPSVLLSQAAAAVYFEQPDDASVKQFKEAGLSYTVIGSYGVLYDSARIDEEKLKGLALFS